MNRITIKSHAKINLALNIIRKREDGFHDIETIFYPVGLHDMLRYERSDRFAFTTDSHDLQGDPEKNLVVRAVRLLEREFHTQIPVAIHLEKTIPMGAGLGGGSSNVAVTLLSVNELYSLGRGKTCWPVLRWSWAPMFRTFCALHRPMHGAAANSCATSI